MQISLIKENDQNPRLIKEEAFEKLVSSIKEDPQMLEARPLIIDENNIVLGGNMRLKALKHLKYEDVPVYQVKDWTKEQKHRFIVKDNLSGGEWDYDLLTAQYDAEELSNWGMEGLDKYFIEEPDEKDDEVPEVVGEPKSKLGDIYELGEHRVLCGDSTKEKDIKNLVLETWVDLVVTDPPYNVDYEGGDGQKIENDDMSDSQFCKFLTSAFGLMSDSMKDGAAFYIWHADSEGYNFRKACRDSGLDVRQCIIWNKNSLVMGRQDYQWKHEPCLYGWKGGAAHEWYGDRNKTTVYTVPDDEEQAFKWFKKELKKQEKENTSVLDVNKPKKNDKHPTMKPLELLTKQIGNSSTRGDVVLDTFLGSGSTLIASEKTNRKCYGMELDPKYVDVIVQRYVDFTGNENVKVNGKEIIWEKSK